MQISHRESRQIATAGTAKWYIQKTPRKSGIVAIVSGPANISIGFARSISTYILWYDWRIHLSLECLRTH